MNHHYLARYYRSHGIPDSIVEAIVKDGIQFDKKENLFRIERHVDIGWGYRSWIGYSPLEYDILEKEKQKRGAKRRRG